MYVGIQVVLFVAYIIPVNITKINIPEWLCYSGLLILALGIFLGIVALLQLNTKLSPFPTPVSNGKLITTGAYNISRHPIYTAIILSGLGYALYQTSCYKVLVTLGLMILFYFKSKYEEQLLFEKYLEYSDYKKKTRRFI
ncbi:protein-S-isoprenylcysteine methyltransferase [Winogradskyella aurantia]|uniref:Protein-S-isoprenylcysteine methyltransferase n=1 Tax=Winogradskyella aurantia TaxID=1915063 RepID=A0A265UXV1_9FLAO|nr:protein-S-isoprenylcysteine methyltransferase [Winogradskyella aurantia]